MSLFSERGGRRNTKRRRRNEKGEWEKKRGKEEVVRSKVKRGEGNFGLRRAGEEVWNRERK